MKTKAFAYLRVSGKGQIKGDGFTRQRETIAEYAKDHKIEIACEFRDEGVSGSKDAFDREGLTDLMVAIKANGVRCILIERADRLARDLMVSEIILAECRKLGVTVIATDADTNLTAEDQDPSRVLIRQVLSAISQWEKGVINQKLRAARLRIKRETGRCEGRKPYGEHQEEDKVIAEILSLKKAGLTNASIASKLNEDAVKTRTPSRDGKTTKWHTTTIQRIIARVSKPKPKNKKQPRKPA